MSDPAPAAAPRPQKPPLPLPKRLWRGLRSVRLAIVLMGLIAVACIVGTLIKQEPYDAATMAKQYGRRIGALIGLLGLNQLYHTGWFITLLGLFSFSTIACTVSRLRFTVRSIGFAVVHLSIVLILAGAIVKGAVGVEGVVTLAEGETKDSFRTDGGPVALGFTLHLKDFRLTRYEDKGLEELLVTFKSAEATDEPETQTVRVEVGKVVELDRDGITVEVLRRLPHFMKDGERVYSASDKPVNPAVEVRIATSAGESTRWLFARFPGFGGHGAKDIGLDLRYVLRTPPVKTFESHVAVLDEAGTVLEEATVMVNTPLRAGRYTLYQLSYDPKTEASSTLEVVYDPGVPLVFVGFGLMPLGMVFVFYIQPLLKRRKRPNV